MSYIQSIASEQTWLLPYSIDELVEENTPVRVIRAYVDSLLKMCIRDRVEIDRFAEIFYAGKAQTRGDMGRLESTLRPALDRFSALEEEKQDLFKSTLAQMCIRDR